MLAELQSNMSTYDSYETVEVPRKSKSHRHHHHRDRERDRDYDPEPRYVETRETYVRGPAPLSPDVQYASRETDLIRRPVREDSDLSIEEVRRDFPPPAGAAYVQSRSIVRDDRYGPPVRSRSADRGAIYGQYLGDPREDRHGRRRVVREEIVEPRRRSLSRNQKIIASVGGAALAVGAKELWDRRQNGGRAPEDRNLLASAAVAAGGAFAGYEGAELYEKKFSGREKVKEKTYMAYQDRDGRVAEYYSSDTEHEKPKKSSRRKSIIEGALGLAGLGAAAKAAGGHDRDDRSDRSSRRSRRRSGSDDSRTSRRRDKSRGGGDEMGLAKIQQAAKAALLAGAAEAFRVRNEPGGWAGAKGKRILTAAIGAGGIDAAADRDPDHHSKRHVLEAVVAGLAGNRLINGSRSEVGGGGKGGRSRSRSRGPAGGAGLAALATAGLGALAGKKLLDRSRSRSRGPDDDRRSRRRSPSDDGYDSDGKRHRRRSKSVTDFARKGLAALGIGEAASEVGRDRHNREVVEETHIRRERRKPRRGSDDSYDDRRDYAGSRGDPYGDSRDGDRRGARKSDGQRNRRVAEGRQSESDSDSLGSSSGDEKRVKKMKGKQFLTAGLATVATIHAAHNVYQSIEKREARKKAVQEGEMSKEEARRLKTKAQLQDAASIGIAALGIKGAISVRLNPACALLGQFQMLTFPKEWKEMREMRHEYKELEEKKEERHQKRMERQKQIQNGGSPGQGGDRKYRRSRDPRTSSAPDLAVSVAIY